MMKRKGFGLLLITMLVLGGGSIYFYSQNLATVAAQSDETEALQTAVARQGDIVVSAIGAGNVIADGSVSLGFSANGTLIELFVTVGSEVAEGDVLARIDDRAAQQALLTAQMQYQQSAMQTDASVTQTGVSYDEISVEQAQINADLAQAALADLLSWSPDEDAIAAAEANLAAAEASYNAALGQASASSSGIAVSAIGIEQAERALAAAQAAYDVAWDSGRDWELNDPRHAAALEAERSRTSDSLLRAQESLEIAQLNHSASVGNSSSSNIANGQTNILSAEQALASALAGPSEDEIEAAETAVRQAELSLQQALLNQEANQISLAQAALNVQSAEEAVAATEIIAPMDGIVTSLNGAVGETVGNGLMTLANLSQPVVELFLDESDLNMVGLGYEVEVVFDALPDDTFGGMVVQIDPELVTESGVTAVRALVELNAESFAKPQILPVGLNATVEVIGGRAENTVLVPVEALRELSPGEFAIFVMEEGEPQLRFVEVGIMDFTFAEILSGITAGEEVTTGIVQTQGE